MQRQLEVLFVAAVAAGTSGAVVGDELEQLLRVLVAFDVDGLSYEPATRAYDVVAFALAHGKLRADHAATCRKLGDRLAEHVVRLNTPRPNGRTLAALRRLGRERDE